MFLSKLSVGCHIWRTFTGLLVLILFGGIGKRHLLDERFVGGDITSFITLIKLLGFVIKLAGLFKKKKKTTQVLYANVLMYILRITVAAKTTAISFFL